MALFNYECDEIKRKIDEVSPNYPQLTTFEREWLYFHKYHYIPGIPVELEYETVSVNPYGSVSNAIPFYYKSAILKGSTKYRDIDTGDILDTFDETKNLELVSVKMPVLTTTGKNLFNGEWELGSIHPETGGDVENKNCIRTKDFFVVESNKEYTISNNKGYTVTSNFYDYAKNLISTSYEKTFITPSNSYFVKFRTSPTKFENDISIKFQIEEDSKATSYEPFKSNILTVNEDVELRGIGKVKDELNLLTGELTQRIYNLQLTGDENWGQSGFTNDGYFVAYTTFTSNLSIADSKLICDKLNYDSSISVTDTKTEGINIIGDCSLRISLSKTKVATLNDFINWIRQEQPVINFVAKEKSIKTVDLNKLNNPYEGTNNYQLTANIPCEAILEVPVVSTGKQTLEEINN